MNRKKYFFPSTSLITLVVSMLYISLFSCTSASTNKKCAEDTIFVSYFIPEIENSVRITCNMMSDNSRKLKTEDIIYLDDDVFNNIQEILILNAETRLDKECDSRLIIESDSLKMCVGNCSSDISSKINFSIDSIVYFVKCKSNYYNFKKTEDLACDNLIQKFGIPSDYVYQENEQKKQWQIKMMRKIAFVKKK